MNTLKDGRCGTSEKVDRLAADFTGLNINHDLPTSIKVAEHAYRHAEISNASLWDRKKGIVEPIGENWRMIITSARNSLITYG